MKNLCVVVLVLLSVAQTAFLWPLEDILSAEADFHPVQVAVKKGKAELGSGRFARAAPSTHADHAAAAATPAPKDKAHAHAAAAAVTPQPGRKVAPGRHQQQKNKKPKQNRQGHPQKPGQKERRQEKRNKKAPTKRADSTKTRSKNEKPQKVAAHHN